jgi:hypothetical protein
MAQCFDDRLATLIVVMTSLTYASKISDSITMGFNILAQLGHQLPTNLSKLDILSRIKQTQIRLGKISDETLVNYRPMTVNRHLQAMNVLAKMELILHQVKPDLQSVVTLTMIDMTIEHGRSHKSTCALAYFAGMLTKLGEMWDALRFAKLAKRLLSADKSKDIAGDVTFITSEVLSFFEPTLTVNEHRVQGQAIASAAGDVNFACMLRLM